MSRALATLAAVTVLAAPLSHAHASSEQFDPPAKVTVKRGQTLSGIAEQHHVPGGFERLHWVNRHRIVSADLLAVGTVLILPEHDGRSIPYVVPSRPVVGASRAYMDASPPIVARNPERFSGSALTVESTAYCLGGQMASGRTVYSGAVAMNNVPLGSRWTVLSGPYTGRTLTVEDRIGYGSGFDIWMSSCDAARAYGRRTIQVRPA